MYQFVDLFAGCGGMSLGFTRAGFQIIGSVEYDSIAASTHAKNFFSKCDDSLKDKHSTPYDITQLSPQRFMKEVLGADSPFKLVDVIVGGPPCQAFARVGRAKLREIMQHPEAFLQDKRANLYLHYLEYVEYFRPSVVVMENVPDIMNFGGTNIAEEIAASLDDLGYTSRYTILNSAYYGVPEMRQRFYLIGIKNDLGIIPTFPQCSHRIKLPQGYDNAQMVALGGVTQPTLFSNGTTHYVDPPLPKDGLPRAISAKEAIEDLPPIDVTKIKRGARKFDKLSKYRSDVIPSEYAKALREWPGFESTVGVLDHVTRYLPRDYKLFKRMKHGDQYPEAYQLAQKMFKEALHEYEKQSGTKLYPDDLEYQRLKSTYVPPYDPGKFPNKWRKMEPDMPARTLTAHIGKDTYSHIHFDSSQSRVISVREAARLQSFPDGFRFSGAMNAAFRQIGNAVPPLQAYAIAKHINNILGQAEKHQPVKVVNDVQPIYEIIG